MSGPLANGGDEEARLQSSREHFERSEVVIDVSVQQMKAVHDAMDAVIEAANSARDLVRELAGPEPGPMPQHLITLMQMGAGYFRAGRDGIRILFRARNSRRRAAKKEA